MTSKEVVKKEQIKKPSALRRVARILFRITYMTIILFIVSLIAINLYLQSNKTKILENLDFFNHGSVTFNSTHIHLFENFPHATFSFSNFIIKDSLYGSYKKPLLRLGQLKAAVSLDQIFKYQAEIQSLDLNNGVINIHTNENNYSNVKNLFAKKRTNGSEEKSNIKIIADQVKVSFSNIDFHLTQDINTTSIHAKIDAISADASFKHKQLTTRINFDLLVDEMSFKKRKGSFVSNSRLSGKVDMSLADGVVKFKPFPLKINEEVFTFSGNYDTKKKNHSTLVLENSNTNLTNTFPLLAKSIQKGVKKIKVNQPFYSKTTITGSFKSGDNALVSVDFEMDDNTVTVNNHQFEKVDLKGRFINRIYNEEGTNKEDKRNYRVELSEVKSYHDGFLIQTDDILIHSKSGKVPQIKSQAKIQGRPYDISRWMQNDKFFFKKGKFILDARIQGVLTDYSQIVIDSKAALSLEDFTVIYQPSNTAFPFKKLELFKEKGDAEFNIASSTLENGHEFKIGGTLKNMIALLFESTDRVSSDVNFIADKIGWTDFVNLFDKNGNLDIDTPKSDQDKKKSMKETIRGVEHSFQPILSVHIDTLQYYDQLDMFDFSSGIYFEDSNTVVIEKTSFKLGNGTVNFRARLDISKEKQTPFTFELEAKKINLRELLPPLNYFNIDLLSAYKNLPTNMSVDIKHKGVLDDEMGLIPHTSFGEISFKVDKGRTLKGNIRYRPATLDDEQEHEDLEFGEALKTTVKLEGDPALFNKFFETNKYFFDKGNFDLILDYKGDVRDVKELFNKAKGTFNLSESEVYYKEGDVTFPLKMINIDFDQDHADFDMLLYSNTLKQQLGIIGNIDNLSEVVIGNTGKQVSTKVHMMSRKVRWDRFLDMFSPKDTSNTGESEKVNALKTSLKGILTSFQPDLSVFVDTFLYSDKLMFEKLQMRVKLRDTATLVLEKSGLKFHDGSISVRGAMDLSKENTSPFSAVFKADDLDLAALLKGLDYLEALSLKNTEKLSGKANMEFSLSGELADDASGLVSATNLGQLDFNISNIILKGFAPLDEMAAKIKMKKRLEELNLAPLINSVKIEGSNIQIPLMEIQSNALNIFIEGTYSYGEDTDLWITIPFYNLKSRDLSLIPGKRGYANAQQKFYLQVTSDENGENKFKFRLSKKKYYKARGILEQYKKDKHKYRKERRAIRKKKRKGG